MFTQDCNFIFVPVDEDFKSLIPDLENSNTPFPSEMDLTGVAGFLLVPAFLDTREILFSPWMKGDADIKGNLMITASTEKDGMIMMNYDPATKIPNPMATGSVQFKKTAVVPGFKQNYAVFLKTGSALLLEKIMKFKGWGEEMILSVDSFRKRGNSYPSNKSISNQYWSLEETVQDLKEMFAMVSRTIGYEPQGDTKKSLLEDAYDLFTIIVREDNKSIRDLKFDEALLEDVKKLATERGETDLVETLKTRSSINP